MFWIIVAIAAWGVVHSWLASLAVKETLRRRMGEWFFRFYRLAYNAFSVVSFLPILVLVRRIPDRTLYSVPAPWLYMMAAGQLAAVVLLVAAVLQTGAASFAGLRQVVEGEKADTLVTGGFYRWVRHPLYLLGLVILWLTPVMTLNMLAAYVALSVYLFMGAIVEERKLVRQFGSAYATYKRRTPMIVPMPVRTKRITQSD